MANFNNIIKEEIIKVAGKLVQSQKCKIAVGEASLYIIEENFEAEGRPKWKAWTAAYAKVRAMLPYPLKIGTLTGTMRNSIKYRPIADGVTVYSYNVNYTKYFDAERKIFTFPTGYMQIISQYVNRAL